MKALLRTWFWRVALVCVAPFAAAQDALFERVEVRVSGISAASIYLDRGSDAGLATGDRVELQPAGRGSVMIVVRSVSKLSARADVSAPLPWIVIGVRGEALVPRERLEQLRAQSGNVDHPPWTHPPEEWNDSVPLLAPAGKLAAVEEPEPTVSGRVFATGDSTWDHASGERDYALYRTGAELTVEDLYQRGSVLEFDAETYYQAAEVEGGTHDAETRLRLDRLSYTVGVQSEAPRRIQVGRFLQREFPELGLLDGVDVTWRTSSGNRFGASTGYMPEPTAELKTGDDFQGAVYYRYVDGENEELSLGGALQKTWHDGAPDRDLAVIDAYWRPSERLYFTSSAWVDYYTSSDTIKSSGFELTELHLSSNYIWPSGNGVGLFATHYRWPEIKRFEFEPVSNQELLDNDVTRVGLNGWRNLSKKVRLDARVDYWQDQDDDGNGGELRLGVLDLICDRSQVSAAVFGNQGSFSKVLGGRMDMRYFGTRDSWGLTYDLTNADQDGFNGTQASLAQHAVRASWDRSFEDGWMLSVYAEDRFGDEQDSNAVGFFLQRRF